MLEITPGHRAALRTLSHPIKPTVWIGAAGLSEAVIHELDQALKSHELIKIKVSNDERETREALLKQICERLEAAPVRHMGRILVIYRPAPDEAPGKIRGKNIQKGDNQKTDNKTTSKGKKRGLSASMNKDASRRSRRQKRRNMSSRSGRQ